MGSHVKMPCGWGCGAQLGARGMAKHFATCPKRGGPANLISDGSTVQAYEPPKAKKEPK